MLSLGMKKIPWVIKGVQHLCYSSDSCNPGVVVNTETSSFHGHESLKSTTFCTYFNDYGIFMCKRKVNWIISIGLSLNANDSTQSLPQHRQDRSVCPLTSPHCSAESFLKHHKMSMTSGSTGKIQPSSKCSEFVWC